MKKRKSNPKVHNALLSVLCVLLILMMGAMLFLNHRQESVSNSELRKAAQEEIQKEKKEQTWTEGHKTDGNQTSEDQGSADQTNTNQ